MAGREELEIACTSGTEMLRFLQSKANNHRNFKVYTNQTRLSSWLSENALFLSNGSMWNDTDDRVRFNPPDSSYTNFGTCFSFSKSESVAMWMLYGGMHNEGVMVDFSQSAIKKLLAIQSISLGFWENNQFKVVCSLQKEEFLVELSDTLYCSDPIGTVKRSDSRCDLKDESIIQELRWRTKAYPWCYENECRLVITVNKDKIRDSRISTVRIDVGEVYNVS